jgi:glucokinase
MRAIGVDVGGTNSRSALIELDSGTVLRRLHHKSFVGDSKRGVAALAADIAVLRGATTLPVGVSIAAQLDVSRRVALVAPNLKWDEVKLAEALERRLGGRVVLDNDVRSAAAGELKFGALRRVNGTAAAVFWGSGIGGAVVFGGQVRRGAMNLAGEVGHLAYKPGGRLCGCGKRGCFEAYIGGHNLAARGKKPMPELLRRRAKIVGEALEIFGLLLSHVVNLLDPEAIVIGGGLGLALYPRIAEATAPHLLGVRKGKVKLMRARLGDDAGMLGAAAQSLTFPD